MQKRTREKPPLWNRPVLLRKAFSLGLCPAQRIEITMTAGGSHTTTTRCHALWRDGCGVYHLFGRFRNSHRVPSTPGPFGATLSSRRGLDSVEPPRTSEESLPLEGKVVRLKPDRMRSKVAILYHPMVIIFSFDLISRN
mgnify:CR=1 FL=1